MDVRTFAERKDKPFCLPDRPDAFEIFWPRLTSNVQDCIYHIMKFMYSEKNQNLKNTLKRTTSIDPQYI